MATTAQIVYDAGEGIRIISTITVDASYPDHVDQAKAECLKLFHGALVEARPDWVVEASDAPES